VSQGDALECGSELGWWLHVAPDTSLHCWLWSYPHSGIFDVGWANSIGLPDFGNPENASNQQRTPGRDQIELGENWAAGREPPSEGSSLLPADWVDRVWLNVISGFNDFRSIFPVISWFKC
jgi:hypothetical protein